jgi:hypothetical protein
MYFEICSLNGIIIVTITSDTQLERQAPLAIPVKKEIRTYKPQRHDDGISYYNDAVLWTAGPAAKYMII